MTTIKSYTDLEQSKTLAKILSLESADMNYSNMCPKGVMYSNPYSAGLSSYEVAVKMNQENIDFYIGDSDYKGVIAWEILPCWSLTALLKVIPKKIKDFNVLRIDIDEKDFSIWYDEVGYGVNTKLPDITMECPVDACVTMIEKLHKLNQL